MAFLLPRSTRESRDDAPRIAPERTVLRAAEHAAFRDAHGLLADARAQAQAIVARSQAAYEEHCARGYQDGLEQARLDQAEKMIESVSRTVDYFAKVEVDMVELVLGAVRKIVDGYDDREKVLIVVRNVLAVVRNQKQMTLRLHADDVAVVRQKVNELLAAYPGVGYLDIVADERLGRGACILESEIGMVEASLAGQLQALRSAFERVLGSRI